MNSTSRRLLAALALALTASSIPLDSAAKNFLWKATKGPSTLYLVGSVHVLTKDYYPLNPALDAAFKDSSLLVEEIDLGEMMAAESQMQMLAAGMLPAGQTLALVGETGETAETAETDAAPAGGAEASVKARKELR